MQPQHGTRRLLPEPDKRASVGESGAGIGWGGERVPWAHVSGCGCGCWAVSGTAIADHAVSGADIGVRCDAMLSADMACAVGRRHSTRRVARKPGGGGP
eukprot:1760506-Rhodomonas_salina.1